METEIGNESNTQMINIQSLKSEKNFGLKTSEESFENIDLQIEKEEIMTKDDFYSNPTRVTQNISQIKIWYKYKRIGNTFAFWYNKEGDPLILIGPHWPLFICLSSTISLISFLYFHFLLDLMNPYARVVGILIYSIQTLSYTYTFLKNPGLPKYNYSPVDVSSRSSGIDFCQECHIYISRDKKIRHCHDCNICVEGIFLINYVGYDHHCPWTSKCVGDGNIYGFYLFVASTMVLMAYLVFGISIINTNKK